MKVSVLTLFPQFFDGPSQVGMLGRAVTSGQLQVACVSIRNHGLGVHRAVDDSPYGGGSGMVMRCDCVVAAMEEADQGAAIPAHRVLLTPQGRPLRQGDLAALSQREHVALVCGRYEGFDERVRSHVHDEISLGDFILAGGEIAALAIIEGIARLLPGVLGNPESLTEESHGEKGGLEYPQYTRPVEFRGARVPDVLMSGHHADIRAWREAQAQERTRQRRPDLIRK